MKSTIKTIILAAAGAAVMIASPALAKSKRTIERAPTATVQYQEGVVAPQWQGDFNGNDTFGQIRGEYLKDAPAHNGNAY